MAASSGGNCWIPGLNRPDSSLFAWKWPSGSYFHSCWIAEFSGSDNDQKFPAKNAEKSPIIGPAKKKENFGKKWIIKSSIYLYNIKLLIFSRLNPGMAVPGVRIYFMK
jgi:hypothetical protein